MDRASASEAEGRRFESSQARQDSWGLSRIRAGFKSLTDNRICLGPLAQLVEQLTLNQRVAGSIPARPTKNIKGLQRNL